ncbi:hypothetical protein HYZ64_00690 [Candidatus Berkelbacteria bacterium]|nr:hypothetical protein [Candidatus Berkelbacteria bacterium]
MAAPNGLFTTLSTRTLVVGILIGALVAALAITIYAGKASKKIIGKADPGEPSEPTEEKSQTTLVSTGIQALVDNDSYDVYIKKTETRICPKGIADLNAKDIEFSTTLDKSDDPVTHFENVGEGTKVEEKFRTQFGDLKHTTVPKTIKYPDFIGNRSITRTVDLILVKTQESNRIFIQKTMVYPAVASDGSTISLPKLSELKVEKGNPDKQQYSTSDSEEGNWLVVCGVKPKK